MSTDDDGGQFNFNPDELDPDGRSGDTGPADESGDTRAGDASGGTGGADEPDTRGEDEHEVGGGHTGMGKGPTGS